MTDLDANAVDAPPVPQIRILAQFTRDFSFENPPVSYTHLTLPTIYSV